MRAGAIVALVFALPLMTGCGRVEEAVGRDVGAPPLDVVATTGMIGDAAAQVGGARVDVTTLMGPGVDPHLYKASEGDVGLLAGADLVFFNGLHLEAKLSEVLERLEGRTVAVTERLDRSRLLAPPQFAGAYDPHVWFDVRLWMRAVERVRDALVDLDPAGRRQYEANAERYLAELRALDAYVREQAGRVPRGRRVIVTAHDAFNYFGRAYGFDVRGLQGISTVSEAGAAEIQELARFIAERRIPTIFVESSVSPRAIEAVREAVRARGFDVGIGEQLFSDALGDPDTPEGTYLGMVRHNVDAIVTGLTREAG